MTGGVLRAMLYIRQPHPAPVATVTQDRKFNEGELRERFNNAAGFVKDAHESGEDDERYQPWGARRGKP